MLRKRCRTSVTGQPGLAYDLRKINKYNISQKNRMGKMRVSRLIGQTYWLYVFFRSSQVFGSVFEETPEVDLVGSTPSFSDNRLNSSSVIKPAAKAA